MDSDPTEEVEAAAEDASERTETAEAAAEEAVERMETGEAGEEDAEAGSRLLREGRRLLSDLVEELGEDSFEESDERAPVVEEPVEVTEEPVELEKPIEEAAEAVEEATEAVEKMAEAVEEIPEAVEETTEAVEKMVEAVEEIPETTDVVEENAEEEEKEAGDAIVPEEPPPDESLRRARELLAQKRETCDLFRRQRDSAVEERNGLVDIVKRLNAEMIRLKELHADACRRLNAAVDSNCEIVAKHGELRTRELALDYREELLRRERAVLDERVDILSAELSESRAELETARLALASKVSDLEIRLQAKTEELAIADGDVAELRADRLRLTDELGALQQRLHERRLDENKEADELRRKLAAKTKIGDLHKSMRDDSEAKCRELTAGVAELQRLLKEAVEKYGDLEARHAAAQADCESALAQRDERIAELSEESEGIKAELQRAKADAVGAGLRHLSPTASIAREFIKSGKTLNEIYCEFVRATDELAKARGENAQLQEALSTILAELERNAPFVKRRRSQSSDEEAALAHRLEAAEMELDQLKQDYSESMKVVAHYERENKKLTGELHDLGRQVCFLLKEMEISRGRGAHSSRNNSMGLSSDGNTSFDVISRHLVTFGDIEELQSNNRKLLKLVRELSEKRESDEALRDQIETGELQAKLETLSEKVAELSSAKERQTERVNELIKQKDMYKRMYHSKLAGGDEKKDDASELDADRMDTNEDKKCADFKVLESQIEDYRKRLLQQKEEMKKFADAAETKERLLVKQRDRLQKEHSELNETYRKCICSLESNNERHKFLQNDLANQKKKVAMFEERHEKYVSKVAELEMSVKYLQDKLANAERKLSHDDALSRNLRNECKLLKDTNDSLLNEKEQLTDIIQSQKILINGIETLKDCVTRRSSEDKSRLDTKLEEFARECSLLQKKLDENKLSFSYQLQFKNNTVSLEDIRLELKSTKEELEKKTKLIDEMSSQEPGFAQNKALQETIKSLKSQLDDSQCEINTLQQQFADHRNHTEQLKAIAENSEKEAKVIHDTYLKYKTSAELQLVNSEKEIHDLKTKCFELETELSLHTSNQDEIGQDLKLELAQSQERISELSRAIEMKNNAISDLNTKIIDLSESLQLSKEAHDANNSLLEATKSELSICKEEIIDLFKQINGLKNVNTQDRMTSEECKRALEEKIKVLDSEKDQVQSNMNDLREQNVILLDQIETLHSQALLTQNLRNVSTFQGQDSSLNDSILSDSAFNMSENDSKDKSKLMQVIAYLRKQRDDFYSQYDTLQKENMKIKSELEISTREISHLKNENISLPNSNHGKSNHLETVHNAEAFNAISHSNKLLREERDNLLSRINELSAICSKTEESLSSLQTTNTELAKRINGLTTENVCIQAECNKWKSKVNVLSEKASKTNHEDWKRLQNEREALGKILLTERENCKKLKEEALVNKLEKSRLEEQNNTLNKQQLAMTEECKRQVNEINSLKKETSQLSLEVAELKASITEKSEENQKLKDSLANHLEIITNSRHKEAQLRKIAKNYKAQYDEVAKQLEDAKKSGTGQAEVSETQQNPDLEKAEPDLKISELLEQNSSLVKDNEDLRNRHKDMETKAMQRLKESKAKILLLTEQNDKLTRDLEETRAKVDLFEQNRDENNDMLAALKSQYEGKLIKMEKEKLSLQHDLIALQHVADQLSKELEVMTQKNSQMQKHMDNQQSVKSSTSLQAEKVITEPPTANIKPMSGSQQSISGRRLGNETPLASIKPMTSVTGTRTAAVLPNAQFSVASIQPTVPASSDGSSSSLSTEIAQSVSSNRCTGSPLPQHPLPDTNEETDLKAEVTDTDVLEGTQQSHQTVALVSPRMGTPVREQQDQPQSPNPDMGATRPVSQETEMEAFEEHEATAQKRSRVETEQENPASKRPRTYECEPDYQQPTSSQKIQDDSVIVVDSDDEDEVENRNVYAMEGDEDIDDEEDDEEEEEEEEDEESSTGSPSSVDNNEAFPEGHDAAQVYEEGEEEEEEGEAVHGEMVGEEEEGVEAWQGGGGDDEDEDGDDIEEVPDEEEDAEGGEDREIERQSHDDRRGQGGFNPISGTSRNAEVASNYQGNRRSNNAFMRASGNASGIINTTGVYEEGDDGIVPSTPTLFVPSRNDGFGEAVRSPMVVENVDRNARFSFGNPNAGGGSEGNVLENTQADLTNQLESHHSSNSDGSGLVIDVPEGAEEGNRNVHDDEETGENRQ